MPDSTITLLRRTMTIARSMTIALFGATAGAQATVDFASLVREARDLRALAQAPKSVYRVLQWSSGGANRGIEAVLQQPDARGNGEYLLGEVLGSGAIVATWTNGMNGRIRMIVDGDILWDGEADTFLRRRSAAFLAMSGAEDDASHPVHAFTQGDWDFLPVPFARSLRIEWSGDARREPAFRLAVRHWLDGTWVNPFRFEDLRGAGEELARTARELRDPELGEIPDSRRELNDVVTLAPQGEVSLDHAVASGSRGDAISVLRVRIEEPSGDARARVLHGVVLRIAFDGAERPQVEAPLAGFFGAAAGSVAFASQPIAVQADGWMICRFPMPYHSSAKITFADRSGVASRIACERAVDAMDVDLDTFQFRARWRVERGLEFGKDGTALELPLLLLRGSGRLVGHAVAVVNPSGSITPSDNAWLCGDETLLLDRDADPALRGPGSATARAFEGETFDRPWVGCPLASGPGGAGLVLQHRFRILDAVPFQSFLGSWVALHPVRALTGVEHASISYVYARPGAVDDHRPLRATDLAPPVLPLVAPVARDGERAFDAEALSPRTGDATPPLGPDPFAARGTALVWRARAGEVLALRVPDCASGAHDVTLVLAERPDAARIAARIGGRAATVDGESDRELRREGASQYRAHVLAGPRLGSGDLLVELIAASDGVVRLDTVFVRLRELVVDGCVEGEALELVDAAPGVAVELAELGRARFSAGQALAVRIAGSGDHVLLRAGGLAPGRHAMTLRLVAWDSPLKLAIDAQGEHRAAELGLTGSSKPELVLVDLGTVTIGADGVLDLRIAARGAPGSRFGIDGVVLAPAR